MQQAVEVRDALHWDIVFVVTAAELIGHYSSFCFAALSRPLDAAAFSMSLIDPQAIGEEVAEATRVEQIAQRLSRLMLHALGHLSGLSQSDNHQNLMFPPAGAEDLDQMETLDAGQIEKQRTAIAEMADQRLEEGFGRNLSYPAFAVRAAWINRREILEAVWAARPWQFPRRLSRLTLAAVSTLAILFMTAEAWDLALSQDWMRVNLLTVCTLLLTTGYVIARQQLLLRRGRKRSEQTVVTSASALAIVLVGMATAWTTLLGIGLGIGWLLFRPHLIASWAASTGLLPAQVDFLEKLQMSCVSASLGLLIGALGASFESQHYFRHVIFVDEEI